MSGVRSSDIALFFRRLHAMLQAGVSLPNSLSYLEIGEPNPAFRSVLQGCLDTVLKGFPLSTGMRRYSAFSTLTVEMVANGEKMGSLVATFGHLSTLQERQIERRQRIVSAMAYPLCLLTVMLLVVGLFVTFVAPGDEGLFAVLGDDVPWPSQVLIALSGWLSNPWLMGVTALILGTCVGGFRKIYRDSPAFRLQVDTFCLDLPVIGPLLSRLDSARCLDVLASSLKVGLSIVAALKNSIRVASNAKFRQDLEAANSAIMQGQGLGSALADSTSIPRFATSLIEVAEEAGQLDEALERTAAILDDDVNDALSRAVALAEPLLLSVGGVAAGFVAVATFLPIIRLVSNL